MGCGICCSLLNDYQAIKREIHKSNDDEYDNDFDIINIENNIYSSKLKFISVMVIVVTILLIFLNVLHWM